MVAALPTSESSKRKAESVKPDGTSPRFHLACGRDVLAWPTHRANLTATTRLDRELRAAREKVLRDRKALTLLKRERRLTAEPVTPKSATARVKRGQIARIPDKVNPSPVTEDGDILSPKGRGGRRAAP